MAIPFNSPAGPGQIDGMHLPSIAGDVVGLVMTFRDSDELFIGTVPKANMADLSEVNFPEVTADVVASAVDAWVAHSSKGAVRQAALQAAQDRIQFKLEGDYADVFNTDDQTSHTFFLVDAGSTINLRVTYHAYGERIRDTFAFEYDAAADILTVEATPSRAALVFTMFTRTQHIVAEVWAEVGPAA